MSVPTPGVWPVVVKDIGEPAVITSVRDIRGIAGLSYYPDPVLSEVHISSDDIIKSISVLSISGATLLQISDINSVNYNLTMDGINPGVYFIKIRSDGSRVKVGLIIKK